MSQNQWQLLLHQSDTKAWDDDDFGSMSHVNFFSPGCLITWWSHLIVCTTFDLGNAIFPIGLNKIFLITNDKPIGPTAWKSVQGRLLYHL
jgi:hypothetical protein